MPGIGRLVALCYSAIIVIDRIIIFIIILPVSLLLSLSLSCHHHHHHHHHQHQIIMLFSSFKRDENIKDLSRCYCPVKPVSMQ